MRLSRGVFVLLLTLTGGVEARAADPDADFFEARIRPVLVESCVRCHGPNKASGGLRVDSREALLKGGDSGPALVIDDPASSLLLKAVRRDEKVQGSGNPEAQGDTISEEGCGADCEDRSGASARV